MLKTPSTVKWLIETLHSLRRAELDARSRGELDRAKDLQQRRIKVERLWQQHPLHFEITELPDRVPSHRTQTLRDQVRAHLSRTAWVDAARLRDRLQMSCAGRPIGQSSVEKALRQLLLEGLVVREFAEDGQAIVWRLKSN